MYGCKVKFGVFWPMPANISKHELDPFRSGDPVYFIRIANQVQDLVVGYIFGQIGRIDAARRWSVEAFTCLYNHLDVLPDEEAFMLTLHQCTKNCCEKAKSDKNLRSEREIDDKLGTYISEILQAMDAHERLMAILTYLFGSTQANIARFTGMPLSMVQRRLKSAQQKLPALFLELPLSEIQRLRPSRDARFSDEVGKEITRLYNENRM
jgi:DNA-directed RNA polymerase specialized sigma24 family protein